MRHSAELPPEQRRIAEAAARVADRHELFPWLVGGPVRDLFLGRPVVDLDLTLEGGAEVFAHALAEELGAMVRSFPQFLTFKIVSEDLPEVDVATTRVERYPLPGALPVVEPGNLEDDLARRDFSVNAMAYSLTSEELIDPLGGLADLERRRIRILHERSFIDDPTRIFRALRLASRLGFDLEEDTADLLLEAADGAVFSTVSRQRLWREIFLAFQEAQPAAVLRAFVDSGALGRFAGPEISPSTLPARLRRLEKQLAKDHHLDREVVFLAALLEGSQDPMTSMAGAPLSLRRKHHVVELMNGLSDLMARIALAMNESERLRLCQNASDELVAVAAAEDETIAALSDRSRELRDLRLDFGGDELGVPPGPHVGQALQRTREALLLGEISRDEAAAFATRMALQYLRKEP